MTDFNDAAFYAGASLIGYDVWGVLGAGAAMLTAAVAIAVTVVVFDV